MGEKLFSGMEGTATTGGAEYIGRGLEGYGGRNRAKNDLWSQYYAGYGQALGGVENQRAIARNRIGDIISQWREALSSA